MLNFKSFLLSALLVVSTTVGAVSEQPVYLATPVKEQTGMYFIETDYIYSFGGVMPNAGVSLEIVEPPNRLVPGGGPATNTFVFGTFYDVSGRYFVFSGTHFGGNSLEVVVYRRTSDGNIEVFGTGILEVDAEIVGNAHKIRFFFDFSVSDYRYVGSPVLSGNFIRATDLAINRCKYTLDFSPIDPFDDKPCLPAE